MERLKVGTILDILDPTRETGGVTERNKCFDDLKAAFVQLAASVRHGTSNDETREVLNATEAKIKALDDLFQK
jgi:hypothetical protein